jgi:rhodanese-related sulfurtransferase
VSDELSDALSVDELLAEARAELTRLTPEQARAAHEEGAVIVDIRPIEQREVDGEIPGAHVIPRNVLEWRLDPNSDYRDANVARTDRQVIVTCDAGYQSSLAAATLRRLGLDATDLVGGFQAWRDAGLPVKPDAGRAPD